MGLFRPKGPILPKGNIRPKGPIRTQEPIPLDIIMGHKVYQDGRGDQIRVKTPVNTKQVAKKEVYLYQEDIAQNTAILKTTENRRG